MGKAINATGIDTNSRASAYRNGAQNISSPTKIQLETENYDPGANFDNATNYRWTCPTAGKYLVTWQVVATSVAANECVAAYLYKNGSQLTVSQQCNGANSNTIYTPGTAVIDLAAGDYLEVWGAISSAASRAVATGQYRCFLDISPVA